MKLKKIKVPKFSYHDDFGIFTAHDVHILFDPVENEIKPENFDQASQSFFVASEEIERLARESAQRFFDTHAGAMANGSRPIKSTEVNAIKTFLKISGAELGDLIGLTKSSISRILKGEGKQDLQWDKLMLLLERLRNELEHPGKCKILLEQIRNLNPGKVRIEKIEVPALQISEFFIRRFSESDAPMTNLKLQKLLYYSQGIGFRRNVKLFKEPLHAWKHGPVVEEVYHAYKIHGNQPIPVNPEMNLDSIQQNEMIQAVLEETISLYGLYDAWFLRQKTHGESPWLDTSPDSLITDAKMINFFKKTY